MTVIAYRDGVMASDSQISFGESMYIGRPKIFKVRKHLIGATGQSAFCWAFVDWFKAGCKKPFDMPKEGLNAIVVKPSGDLFLHLSSGLVPWHSEYYTTGSGEDIALGALAVGATAVEAVEAAIKHNVYCGGPVQCLKL